MYLDHTDAHRRFASYLDSDLTAPSSRGSSEGEPQYSGLARDAQNQANYWERYFGLQEQELQARMSQASRQSQDSRASLNAQMKAEKARLQLAREQMERVSIPQVEIQRFVAQKNAQIATLGMQLDYLNAYAKYQSSPDTYWLARSFKEGYGRLANNAMGMDPHGDINVAGTQQDTSTAPQPQSLQGLVADLTGGTGSVAAGVSGQGGSSSGGSGDPRVDAVAALTKASPPSPYDGLSADDQATLRSIAQIYGRGLGSMALGSLENMDPAQRDIFLGGGARLGYSNPSELYKYDQSRWTSGNAAAA